MVWWYVVEEVHTVGDPTAEREGGDHESTSSKIAIFHDFIERVEKCGWVIDG